MSDDLLRRASEALRDTEDGRSDRARETRARLLAEAGRSSKSRKRVMAFVLPLAAVLAVSSAWAAATGRVSAAWHEVERITDAPAPARAGSGPAVSQLVRGIAQAPPVQQVEGQPPSATAPSASVAPSASAAKDADHADYLVAHRTHFSGGEPSAALAAWDSYLRTHPSGRFAPEARYNRALCLVKLGRKAEASQALEPFARGAYGGYRQSEAKALREALVPAASSD